MKRMGLLLSILLISQISWSESDRCDLNIDRTMISAKVSEIEVEGMCFSSAQKQELEVSVSDGETIKKIKCPEEVELATERRTLCKFKIDNLTSTQVRALLPAIGGTGDVEETFYKLATNFYPPTVRILPTSQLTAERDPTSKPRDQVWTAHIRVHIEDKDLDKLSPGSARVDLIQVVGATENLIESRSFDAQNPDLDFVLERHYLTSLIRRAHSVTGNLPDGESKYIVRAYDANDDRWINFIDSVPITVQMPSTPDTGT
jgi:hypothetical protein